MSDSEKKSATWHTPVAVALAGIILLSAVWIVVNPAESSDPGRTPPVLTFSPERLMQELNQPMQFEDPIAGRAQIMAAAREVAQEISERSGAVVLNKKAAIGAPESIDITSQVLKEARRRIDQAEPTE